MQSTNEMLMSRRAAISRYFLDMAKKEGLVLKPVEHKHREIPLHRRLYEEKSGDRVFIIQMADQAEYNVDAFVKKTGIDYQTELIHVISSGSQSELPYLWELYKIWIIEKKSEKEIDVKIKSISNPE